MRQFRYTVGSDVAYEDLIGEVYYGDHLVCRVSQEAGPGLLRIAFIHTEEPVESDLSDFERCLAELRSKLEALRRID